MSASKVPSRALDNYDVSTRIFPGQKAFSLFTRRPNPRPIHGFRLSLLTGAQASSAFAGLIVALTVALPALMWACQHVNITHYSHFGGAVGGLLGLQYLTALVAMLWKYRNRIPVGQISGGSWRDKLPAGLVPAILVTLTLTAVLIAWLGVLGSVAAGVFGYLTQHIGGHLQ